MDADKVQSTLKQLVRDWSEEGASERKLCYKPLLDEIIRLFGHLSPSGRSNVRVLVPGAGLGRLAFEVARLGFECQGNEFSLFMLIAANYILNRVQRPASLSVHPWIHQYTNVMRLNDQTRVYRIPDVDPSGLPSQARFSMAAGGKEDDLVPFR
jgi:carnosine N-methyltransferase